MIALRVGEVIPSTYSGPLLSDHCGPVKLDAGATRAQWLPVPDANVPIPKSVWTCGS